MRQLYILAVGWLGSCAKKDFRLVLSVLELELVEPYRCWRRNDDCLLAGGARSSPTAFDSSSRSFTCKLGGCTLLDLHNPANLGLRTGRMAFLQKQLISKCALHNNAIASC